MESEKVHLTKKAIYIGVPSVQMRPNLSDSKRMITLVIPVENIQKIQMFTGPNIAGALCTPLIFITATPSACERIRKDLNLNLKSKGLYYDSTEQDDTMKYITMLPKSMDVIKNYMKRFYGESITELNEAQANQKLVNTTPKNVLKSRIYNNKNHMKYRSPLLKIPYARRTGSKNRCEREPPFRFQKMKYY